MHELTGTYLYLKTAEIIDIVTGEKVFGFTHDSKQAAWKITSDRYPPDDFPKEMRFDHFLPMPRWSDDWIDPTTGLRAGRLIFDWGDVLWRLGIQVEVDLRDISYLGPLRTEPERFYYFTGENVSAVGQRGENTFKLVAAARDEGREDDFARLDWWLDKLAVCRRENGVRPQKSPTDTFL